MATHNKPDSVVPSLPAPSATVSSWTGDDIRKSDILVFRESAT